MNFNFLVTIAAASKANTTIGEFSVPLLFFTSMNSWYDEKKEVM
jgi:hypothetical protein